MDEKWPAVDQGERFVGSKAGGSPSGQNETLDPGVGET
jgi:hypothetical protein